jgi:hypothetical protein
MELGMTLSSLLFLGTASAASDPEVLFGWTLDTGDQSSLIQEGLSGPTQFAIWVDPITGNLEYLEVDSLSGTWILQEGDGHLSSGGVPADAWIHPDDGGGGENPIPSALGGSEPEGELQSTPIWRRACLTAATFATCAGIYTLREVVCHARSEVALSRLHRNTNSCAASGGLPTYSVVHRPSDSLVRCDSQTITFTCIRPQEF